MHKWLDLWSVLFLIMLHCTCGRMGEASFMTTVRSRRIGKRVQLAGFGLRSNALQLLVNQIDAIHARLFQAGDLATHQNIEIHFGHKEVGLCCSY